MKSRGRLSNQPTEDHLLAELVEEYTARLQAGEPLHWNEFIASHPERESGLRLLLPALHMLANIGQSDSRLEGAPNLGPQTPIASNEQLGDYRLIREIGRGGMGVVYEAEQCSLKRRVAVKVLPYASLLDSRQLKRFQNEAQAAACLQHEHIVPVFAVGCERGIHYYAMQLIDGQSLDQMLWGFQLRCGERIKNANHSADTSVLKAPMLRTTLPDQGVIPLRSLVRLTIQAAVALEHAHQQGIVHRDIKPGNLLVNHEGDHLWITDFGLARCQSDADLTRTGDLLGTLRYMSPEQALAKPGVVDQRTDIYALGATLYELLTLQPVFPGQSRQELLRQVADQEPAPLRRHNGDLPVELETIVLKALAKNPAERYTTAREFADDLQRFLDDRPIRARRPTLVERAVRWGRRHRSVVAAASVALAILFVAQSISTIIILRQRDRVVDLKDVARSTVNDMYVRFVKEWLSQKPLLEAEQRDLLLKALHFYEGFAAESGNEPGIQLRVAHAQHCVADIQAHLDQKVAAKAAYEKALALLQELDRATPDTPAIANSLAGCWNDLGNLHRDCARATDARSAYRTARVLFARQVKSYPDDAVAWAGLAGCTMNLGVLQGQSLLDSEGESLLREAVAIDRHWLSETPGTPSWKYDLAAALGNLADLLSNQSRFNEAQSLYVESLASWKSLTADYPDRLNYRRALVGGHCGLAALLSGCGRAAPAEQNYREAIVAAQRLAADYPRVPDFGQSLASTRVRLARVLRTEGKTTEAETTLRQALEQLGSLAAKNPQKTHLAREVVACEFELAQLLHARREVGPAEELYRKAALHADRLLAAGAPSPEDSWLRAQIASRTAELFQETGRHAAAFAECDLALSIKSRVAAANPGIAGYQADLAWSLLDCVDLSKRDAKRAADLAMRATDLRPNDGAGWMIRGAALYRVGRWQEAASSLEKARQLRKNDEAMICYYLALSYQKTGESTKATEALRQGELNHVRNEPNRAFLELREEARQALPRASILPQVRPKREKGFSDDS